MKRILLVTAAVFLTASCFGGVLKEGFESGSIKTWEVEGDAKVSADQKHSGSKSLFVPLGAKASWTALKDNKFGKVIMWVYDSKTGGKVAKDKFGNANGPKWSVFNADGDKLFMGLVDRTPSSPHKWGTYYMNSTADSPHNWLYVGGKFIRDKTAQGWHKFEFNMPDAKTTEVILDEADTAALPVSVDELKFSSGFVGVCFEGGAQGEEKFCYDDIEISTK